MRSSAMALEALGGGWQQDPGDVAARSLAV